MGRVVKSQWEFGDLFEKQPPARKVFTVGELTGNVRRLLEKELNHIWVAGEISSLRVQQSGHIYFCLKDGHAQLQCVLFRGERVAHRQLLQDGQHVELFGDLTVYEPRGQYQLRVLQVELQGLGALQAAFEALKRKLQGEGLFAQERKRPLPPFPQRLGLVTSPTGAALHDVLHVLARRHPSLELLLAPCRVQGEGAAREIVRAIQMLNEWSLTQPPEQRLDLILVTRGGGSLEDLWPFNEEIVARAVVGSALPVVSAVGHEIDFTICDFVADLRAATPSAAAEIISERVHASREFVRESAGYMQQLILRRLRQAREEFEDWVERLGRAHPRRALEMHQQLLDELLTSLRRGARRGLRDEAVNLVQLHGRMLRLKPSLAVQRCAEYLSDQTRRLRDQALRAMEQRRANCRHLAEQLRLLGPEGTLARGYSITMAADTGKILHRADQTQPGQRLRTRLQSGTIESTVDPPAG